MAPAAFLVQEGNKIAAQLKAEMIIGDGPEKKLELMFMGTRDDQGDLRMSRSSCLTWKRSPNNYCLVFWA